MITPESSRHTAGRLDLPILKEVDDKNVKCNFMKMMETFNEEGKSSLIETEEKTNKKLEEINKSLTDPQENHEKAIKQVKETVQDLRTKMEVIKKTQIKGRLDMENLGK